MFSIRSSSLSHMCKLINLYVLLAMFYGLSEGKNQMVPVKSLEILTIDDSFSSGLSNITQLCPESPWNATSQVR